MKPNDLPKVSESIQAEQSVIGAILLDNDAIERITDLTAAHFYRQEHRTIYAEMTRQISLGKTCDVLTLFDALDGKIDDCLRYLHSIAQSVGSASNIAKYADIVIDRAIKRGLYAVGGELMDAMQSPEAAEILVDRMAARVESLAQKKTKSEPVRMSDMLGDYVQLIEDRMAGRIKPIQTGFRDLDARLDGGIERGTLTVVAGRPGTGKTAMGLCLARNVAEWGTSLFLSMEMDKAQISDRNIAALGRLPIQWLRKPTDKGEENKKMFDAMTHAFQRSAEMEIFIDDQTALNMLDIRAKCRSVKRRKGLDIVVIDQLSFITGSEQDKNWDAVGEYTRGMLRLAKELNIAVVLLCQLNRKCEERQNKRPMLSDLAASGSIEQDASNVIFLYRDEIYNPDSRDKGICEVITAKQRQGEPGTTGLAYIGAQTRFEDLASRWSPEVKTVPTRKGFEL